MAYAENIQGIYAHAAPEEVQLAETLRQIAEADNLVDAVSDEALSELGRDVIKHFDIDLESMSDWMERMEKALVLAMLVKEAKSYPWDNASNVCFPLVTSAALQYNARAYPAIVPSTDVVKVAVHGHDPQGLKASRAERVARFSTWQLVSDSSEWEKGTDQLLMQLPILGDCFRKMWWDPEQQRVRSRVRLPGRHVVVNNNAPSLIGAPRISEILTKYPHEVETLYRAGLWAECELDETDDDQEPVEFIEQHCRADLDGDGYPEPYIVTVHREKEKVVRIVAGFDVDEVRIAKDSATVLAIDPTPYFVHYQFMPSMDGSFFGTGLGILLGDISDNINSTINMINDAGHMQSLGGGFIGARDFRVKGGVQRRSPGEYKMINVYGDDIRKGIVDVQHPGPSNVLFQMLGLMIDAGREIASVKDVMTGDAGRQNMPVGTVMALIEQGQMVFTASYKRVYRALKAEFAMLAGINAKTLSPEVYNGFLDDVQVDEQGQPKQVMHDPRADFSLRDMDIDPVADPKAVTSMQSMARAQFLMEMAEKGFVDRGEAAIRILEAASIDEIESLMPKPDPVQQQLAAAQQEMMILDIRMKEAEIEEVIANTQAKMASAVKDLAGADTEEMLRPMKAKVEQMKAMKEMIGARREEIERGIAGRMASQPGDGGGSGNSQQGGRLQ